ncbi:MAG: prepilin peptidase [Planctomycetes bacterium]|nr:prepilin peptidase [Planctomycetota bacterium]
MAIDGHTWRHLSRSQRPREPLRGLDAAWDSVVARARRGFQGPHTFLRRAEGLTAQERAFADLTDRRLREAADELRVVFRREREQPEEVDRACALIREAAWRQRGERPFPVQVAGALVLHYGGVAEMATGEGKTLTATLPATLAGWRGRGCHVVTVNDYLARRDAEWMAGLYRSLGLRVAHVEQGMSARDREDAYAADITYCTNKEVTADFLRDRLALGRRSGLSSLLLDQLRGRSTTPAARLVQRGLECAIVDEADSILVDEAVTPLLISADAPNPDHAEAMLTARDLAAELRSPPDYRVDERHHELELTSEGRALLAERGVRLGGVWTGRRRREELVLQALSAKHFYLRDRQYVLREGKVVIVDEFTGRLMPDRTWRLGLHEAIEAKEHLELTLPKETCARISFQRFFRMYRRLSGMTGTGVETRGELWHVFRLPVIPIPTHRPCRREVRPDRVFAAREAKWQAVVEEVVRLHATGRPVLLGTRNVAASHEVGRRLETRGIPHRVLNAVNDRDEAQIIAAAGRRGAVTVATNMAGRGTDIRLGPGAAELGGLHVLLTERHEAGRIDRQFIGRCARQGDPGSAQAFASLEDDLPRRFAPFLSRLLTRLAAGAERELPSGPARALLGRAQRASERDAARRRRAVLRSDHELDELLGFSGAEGG